MFNIKIGVDKPDSNRLKNNIEQLMKRGIRVGNINTAYNFFSEVANSLATRLKYDFGIDNPNSPKQVEYFLVNSNNPVFYDICFQNGKWTSNKEALQILKDRGYEFASVLLQYRKAKKLAESAMSLLKSVDKNSLIHPVVSLTKTNRISYTGPALMNIPKNLLWNVITPYKAGNILWSVDIKNQEPSILINIIDSPKLKEALTSEQGLYEYLYKICFNTKAKCKLLVLQNCDNSVVPKQELMQNANIPPSVYTPVKTEALMEYNGNTIEMIDSIVFRTPVGEYPKLPKYIDLYTSEGLTVQAEVIWEQIQEKDLQKPKLIELEGTIIKLEPMCIGNYRKEFKTSWNALTYESSKKGIVELCKHLDGEKIYSFFYSIPEMKKYQKMWKKQADLGVRYCKTIFGTLLYTDKEGTRQLARSLMDLPIQGTGADILDLLIDHFYKEVAIRGLQDKIMLYYTRHDEAILEIDAEWQNQVGETTVEAILRDIFEHRIDNWVPFKVEVNPVHSDLSSILVSDIDED